MAINQNDYHYWEGSFKGLLPNEILKLSDEDFQTLYEDFEYEGLDTYKSAEQCLLDHNKDIQYPFASIDDNIHYASNAFNKCYACNILPKNMQVKEYIEDGHHRQRPLQSDKQRAHHGFHREDSGQWEISLQCLRSLLEYRPAGAAPWLWPCDQGRARRTCLPCQR